jgi:hypothetical protein
MRENRTYSSEGGDGESRFLPLSRRARRFESHPVMGEHKIYPPLKATKWGGR